MVGVTASIWMLGIEPLEGQSVLPTPELPLQPHKHALSYSQRKIPLDIETEVGSHFLLTFQTLYTNVLASVKPTCNHLHPSVLLSQLPVDCFKTFCQSGEAFSHHCFTHFFCLVCFVLIPIFVILFLICSQ